MNELKFKEVEVMALDMELQMRPALQSSVRDSIHLLKQISNLRTALLRKY